MEEIVENEEVMTTREVLRLARKKAYEEQKLKNKQDRKIEKMQEAELKQEQKQQRDRDLLGLLVTADSLPGLSGEND